MDVSRFMTALLLALPTVAAAQQGALTQAPTPAGCISDDGSGGTCTDGDLVKGAFSVAVSNDGKNAYVALVDGRALASFARDKKTGALTQLPSPAGCIAEDARNGFCAQGLGLVAPLSVALSPDGRSVYVASFQKDPVSISALTVFARDPRTGVVTQLPGAEGCFSPDVIGCTDALGLAGSSAVAVSKNGANVYVASASGAVAIFARNKQTGALTQLPEPQGCVTEDGSGGRCGEAKTLRGAQAVAVSADGASVYVAARQRQAVAIFTRDEVTGAIAEIPDKAGCISDDGTGGECWTGVGLDDPVALAISPNGKQVYVASQAGNVVAVLARDSRTGMLSQLAAPSGCVSLDGSNGDCTPADGLRAPFSVAVSPDAKHLYVGAREDDAVAVFKQERTGAVTQLASPGGCISGLPTGGVCTPGRALDDPRSVTVSKDGKFVYVAAQGSRAVAVLKRQQH
jgi:DNA-binding beta-propeller fold protein YncE